MRILRKKNGQCFGDAEIDSIISLLWKMHWIVQPLDLVIFPSPWALSFQKNPSIQELSLIFIFLYPHSFLILPFKLLISDFSRSLLLLCKFSLSMFVFLFVRIIEFCYWVWFNRFYRSETCLGFKWVIVDLDWDLCRNE